MAYNNYSSYLPNSSLFQPQYTMGNMYQNYQPPQTNFARPQTNVQSQYSPFSQIMYATLEQAKNYIVDPMQSILFIDKDKSIFSVKSTDLNGKVTFDAYQYSKIQESEVKEDKPQIDTSVFVKQEDLKLLFANLLTKDNLKDFMTKEDIKLLPTKEELRVFEARLDQLQKQIKINEFLNGEKTNG